MRSKIILFVIIAISVIQGKAQIYIADSCRISFFSKTKMENIDAVNTISKPIMSTATGEFDVSVSNAFFEFKKQLMKEHFNEDYMETAKYPKTVFTGKINEKIDFTKNGTDSISISGIMDMHGVKKNITIHGVMVVKDSVLYLKAIFRLFMKDYNIKIPSVVSLNLAESVDVTFTAAMVPYAVKK
jgi:uncharacterized glyoxalase superfamily protein PhnB